MADPLIILGLSGPRGSGKTTAARILEAEYGFTCMAFADPIRQCCRDLFGWTDEMFEPPMKDSVCPVHQISPRHAMRSIGEHARTLDPDIYVESIRNRIWLETRGGARRIVVTDVRFKKEASVIRDADAYVQRAGIGFVYRSVVHVERSNTPWSCEHSSERGPGVKDGDLFIANYGSRDELEDTTRLFAASLLKRVERDAA